MRERIEDFVKIDANLGFGGVWRGVSFGVLCIYIDAIIICILT